MTAITVSEKAELSRLESVITTGKDTFVQVGLALLEIRDRRLYRGSYANFNDYCRERWTFSRQRAGQLICAATLVDKLATKVADDKLPENEREARAVYKALRDLSDEEKVKTINRAESMFTFRGAVQDGPEQVMRRLNQAEQIARKLWPDWSKWFKAFVVLKTLTESYRA